MPFTFITKVNHKPSKKYKEKFNPYLSEVEEIDSKEFADTNMANVGIYVFGDKTQNIDIKYVNSPKESINSLLNKSEFTNYEKEFVKYLEKHGQQECYNAGNHSHCTKKSLARQGITDSDEAQKIINKNILDNSKHLKENRIYLMVNAANGGMNGTAISSKTGGIYKSINELKEEFIKRNQSTGYNVFAFDSINEAKNCKIALQNPLLRFTIYRTQNDQNMMISRVYKYIPDMLGR